MKFIFPVFFEPRLGECHKMPISSSIEQHTLLNSLYISSGSCRSRMRAMVVLPLPANQPASVWALLPQGSTSTQVSHASMASMSLRNCRSALGWCSLSRYCCGVHSMKSSPTLLHLNPASPDGGWRKSYTSCPASLNRATTSG